MNKRKSLLIMLHCKQFTGYAIGVLESVFFDAAKRAGYLEQNIYFSYKSVSDGSTGNIVQCPYQKKDGYGEFIQFLQSKNIEHIIAFDLQFPAPVIPALRKAGVTHIVAYWGASISSVNTGLKLLLKKLEWFLRRSKPDRFIFESEAMRLTATHGRGIPHSRTHVTPLGVNTDTYSSNYDKDDYVHRTLNIPPIRKIVFYSGHMEERKGVRVIVQAAVHLVDSMQYNDIHFVLCGNKGNEAAVYQELLGNTVAESHVTFAGYRGDIAALMRSSHVGVIASTGWDSFTMSSVEMMASGLPMVVSNLQGLAETIENGVNGFHIEPGDFKELAAKIHLLASNTEQALQYSNASRARAITLFSRERQVEDIARVLSQA